MRGICSLSMSLVLSLLVCAPAGADPVQPAPSGNNQSSTGTAAAVREGRPAARVARPARAAGGRPIIGINMDVASSRSDDESTASSSSVGLRLSSSYVDAVTSAGGIPVVLPPVQDPAMIRRYVAMCDGFVFVGGADIDPARYGAEPHPTVRFLHPRRESFDFALMDAVLKSRKPMLGVCGGCQELNVALGGTLIQDIPSETSSTINHKPGGRDFVHDIEIKPNTKLADLLATTSLSVNSIHHQAVGIAGKNIRISARAPDGTIEAIEMPGQHFVLGVQWHPEALTQHPEHLGVYKGLVDAARKGVQSRKPAPAQRQQETR